ncbi:MAG: hypothetical protein M3R27_00420 [Bacteroidota bacterium]|nr:hypothetical protein [Bacteroidota bacterium]
MKDQKEHLQAISEIRSMMERSSRCISLSGLSGIFSGIFALIGAYYAQKLLNNLPVNERGYSSDNNGILFMLLMDAGLVLTTSLFMGTILTMRNSRRKGIKVWDHSAKRLLINLGIPLVTGGLFCIALLYHGIIGLVAPATLVFYGLALINASKYTFNDIRYLGFCEIILGIISCFYIGYGLYFWAAGFGILHIVYGAVMYYKYERN